MSYEEFIKFVQSKCMHETIYEDSEGRLILVIDLLDAYGMVNKATIKEASVEPVAFASHGVVNWIADRQFMHEAALYERPTQQEQLREENERLHVENRRLIDRIESIGVPVGVGGFATTTSAQAEQKLITTVDIEKIVEFKERNP